jgi:hypothetical protein
MMCNRRYMPPNECVSGPAFSFLKVRGVSGPAFSFLKVRGVSGPAFSFLKVRGVRLSEAGPASSFGRAHRFTEDRTYKRARAMLRSCVFLRLPACSCFFCFFLRIPGFITGEVVGQVGRKSFLSVVDFFFCFARSGLGESGASCRRVPSSLLAWKSREKQEKARRCRSVPEQGLARQVSVSSPRSESHPEHRRDLAAGHRRRHRRSRAP